ncbi:phage portal protein, partial [Escherichia coli]
PNGKKDGLQIIPLSEVAAKDEFLNIKNVSRDDMMAAHRVPPQMMGIMPNNVGGFGDVEKASKVFVRNELLPLQKKIIEINNWIDNEVIKFEFYDLM